MLAMRPPVFALVAVLAVLAVPTTITALAIWGSTVRQDWLRAQTPTSNPAGNPTVFARPSVVEKSMTQVWQEWHATSDTSPDQLIFMIATPLAVVLLLLIAFLLIPEVDAGGPFTRTIRNGFRVAVAALIAIVLLAGVHGLMVIPAIHADLRGSSVFDNGLGLFFPCMILSTILLLIAWGDRTARQARGPQVSAPIAPRCERCGYDLTHVPNNGLCPECGIDACHSLERGAARPGTPFERGGGLAAWLATVAAVLFHPARFYSTLTMSDGGKRAERFRHGIFLAIGCGAWCWMFVCGILSVRSIGWDIISIPTLFTLLAVFAGWGTHRLIAAIAASAWIIRRDFSSSDWFRKIIAYETAYLLAFCMFDGAAVTFGIFWGSSAWWQYTMRPLLRSVFLGLVPEPTLLFSGNILLMLFWLFRYRLAFHKTRWANH